MLQVVSWEFSCVLVLSAFIFFSSRRRHTRCALVTGVQTCALPISGYGLVQAMSLQRRAPVLAVEAPEELHHLHDQLGPYVERSCFEQRLLGCGVEGRDLREAVDQRLVVALRDRIPLDDIAMPRSESHCLAFEVRPHRHLQPGFPTG